MHVEHCNNTFLAFCDPVRVKKYYKFYKKIRAKKFDRILGSYSPKPDGEKFPSFSGI